MKLMARGYLCKQIAYELDIGEATVKAHVTQILKKIGVYNKTQKAMRVEQGVKVVKSAYIEANKIRKDLIFIEDLGYESYLDGVQAKFTVYKKLPNTKDMEDYERNKAIKCLAICFDEETAIEIAKALNKNANK